MTTCKLTVFGNNQNNTALICCHMSEEYGFQKLFSDLQFNTVTCTEPKCRGA